MSNLDKQNGRRLWRAAFVIWMLIIWSQSLMPGFISQGESHAALDLTESLLGFDAFSLGFDVHYLLRKIAHLAEYSVLGAFAWKAWADGKAGTDILRLVALGAVIAAIDELLQFIAPDRSPMILDVCIDAIGFVIGLIAVAAISKRFKQKSA